MKILLAHCFYRSSAPSGEDSVYRNEKELLSSAGYEVIPYEKYNDQLNNDSLVDKITSGASFIWSSSSYREVKELIKKYKPDIAHFHNIFPQMSTSVYSACQEMGVPVIQTLHNFRYICPNGLLQRAGKPCELCIDGSLLNSIKHNCYRNSFIATLPMAAMIQFNRTKNQFNSGVDRYIALTEFAKQRFVRAGFDSKKIHIKPNFIKDPQLTQSNQGDYVIYVGRLTQEKGIERLIEASKQLKNIPIKIIGDGELRAKIESVIIQHDLNVELLGKQSKEKVLEYITHSRFLVLPSECYEGFPVTIAEAFACGKAVLATAIGSMDEIVEAGVTGEKFEFGSSESLAMQLNKLWNNPLLAEFYGHNARKIYEEKYTDKIALEHLSSLYQSLT